jgi:hypothetical protein
MSTPNNKIWRANQSKTICVPSISSALGKKERPFDVELPVEV